MKFLWKKDSEGKSVEVHNRFIGSVSLIGTDLFGNKMWDACAIDKLSGFLPVSEYGLSFSSEEQAMKAIEKAIRKAMEV